MPNITPTKQALKLADSLRSKGIDVILEYWDGHKHIDIFIPKGKLYIEIDGLQHFTDPIQFKADLTRDYYSQSDNFYTKHITNQLIDTHLEEISNAIAQAISR